MTREDAVELVHLRNMVASPKRAPSFFLHLRASTTIPETIDDLIDMIAGRILYHLGLDSGLLQVWEGR